MKFKEVMKENLIKNKLKKIKNRKEVDVRDAASRKQTYIDLGKPNPEDYVENPKGQPRKTRFKSLSRRYAP